MPKLYTRNQGDKVRYYGDLRNIGGGQVALKPLGATRATTSETEALKLLAAKIEEVEGSSRLEPDQLAPFVERFLRDNPGQVTSQWLKDLEQRLTRAVEHFGTDRPLASIQPKDLRDWPSMKLSHLAGSTQRHYLHALSGV